MTGLRERKKKDTRSRIQASAIDLINKKGYEATTMVDIAQKADVGVGTVYNYYKTKSDILFSIKVEEVKTFSPDFDEIITKGIKEEKNNSISFIIYSYTEFYLQTFSGYHNKSIWRELFSAALSNEQSIFDKIYSVDSVYLDKFIELLTILQNRNLLGKQVNIKEAVKTFYSILIYNIIMYISKKEMDIDDLGTSVKSQVDVVITGFSGGR